MGASSFVIHDVLSLSSPPLYFSKPSSSFSRGWRLASKESISTVVRRSNTHTLRMLANSNVVLQGKTTSDSISEPFRLSPYGKKGKKASSGKRHSKVKVVIMVDPLEAKRLAAEQMREIQAKEKLKRQRQIEAINGAWAMIGLTAGLVIEGQTGKSILTQVMGYLTAIIGFFWL